MMFCCVMKPSNANKYFLLSRMKSVSTLLPSNISFMFQKMGKCKFTSEFKEKSDRHFQPSAASKTDIINAWIVECTLKIQENMIEI